MSCLFQALAVLPDQDSFYDVTDCLEQLGMETVIQKHLNRLGTEPDLRAQFTTYEVTMATDASKALSMLIKCYSLKVLWECIEINVCKSEGKGVFCR